MSCGLVRRGVGLGGRRGISRTYPTVETIGLRRGLIAIARLGRRGVTVVILLRRTGAQGNAVVSGEFVNERAMSGSDKRQRPRQRQTRAIRVVALGGGEGSWRGRAAVRGLVAGIARHDGGRWGAGCLVLRRASWDVGGRGFFAHPLAEPSKGIRWLEEGGADGAR